MEVFNIIKPDMIYDKNSLTYYFNELGKILELDKLKMYNIPNWALLSRKIYEMEIQCSSLSLEECLLKRKQFLTTIIGYSKYNIEKNGAAIVFSIDEKCDIVKILNEMYLLKKRIRKKYVAKSNKLYLKYLDEGKIDFSKPLYDIDINHINTEVKMCKYNEFFFDSNYNMIFFNKLHSPDVNLNALKMELDILYSTEIISEEKIIRKLKI